jgi:hypothetical protein
MGRYPDLFNYLFGTGAFRPACRLMGMRIRIIAVCLSLFSAGCSHPVSQKAPAENWTILVSPATQEANWNLEESKVPGMLSGTKAYLEHGLTNVPDRGKIAGILSRWESYSCQLFPTLDRQSMRKAVVLSFFPSSERSNLFRNWRSTPVMVKGGGYDYWRVSYDPEKREYSQFSVNALE